MDNNHRRTPEAEKLLVDLECAENALDYFTKLTDFLSSGVAVCVRDTVTEEPLGVDDACEIDQAMGAGYSGGLILRKTETRDCNCEALLFHKVYTFWDGTARRPLSPKRFQGVAERLIKEREMIRIGEYALAPIQNEYQGERRAIGISLVHVQEADLLEHY